MAHEGSRYSSMGESAVAPERTRTLVQIRVRKQESEVGYNVKDTNVEVAPCM